MQDLELKALERAKHIHVELSAVVVKIKNQYAEQTKSYQALKGDAIFFRVTTFSVRASSAIPNQGNRAAVGSALDVA